MTLQLGLGGEELPAELAGEGALRLLEVLRGDVVLQRPGEAESGCAVQAPERLRPWRGRRGLAVGNSWPREASREREGEGAAGRAQRQTWSSAEAQYPPHHRARCRRHCIPSVPGTHFILSEMDAMAFNSCYGRWQSGVTVNDCHVELRNLMKPCSTQTCRMCVQGSAENP